MKTRYEGYTCLKLRLDRGVAFVTIDGHCFNQSVATAEARRRMARFLAVGGQTRQVELDLERVIAGLAE